MQTSPTKAITLILALFLVNLLFLSQGLYEKSVYLDNVMHFLGGCAIAFLMLQLIDILLHLSNKKVIALLTVLGTFAVAVLWEIMEFGSDVFLESNLQMGTTDTIVDVLLGVFGAMFVAFINSRRVRA